jgi:hypothetical protein
VTIFSRYVKKKVTLENAPFKNVTDFFKYRKDLNFSVDEDSRLELVFPPDFKSPFPSEIMGDEELKNVISKMYLKLAIFCF